MVGTRRSARLMSREDNKEAKRQRLEGGGDDQGDPGGAQAAPEQQEGYKKLPTEIWLHVFSFLPAQPLLLGAALVCKEWRKMAMAQKKHLKEFKFVRTSVTAAKACRLICRWPGLKIVRLYNWRTSVDVILRAVAKKLPGLAVLDLRNIVIRKRQSLELVAQSCKSLREVRLDRGSSYNCERTRHILDIFSNCPKLEKLIVDTYCPLWNVLPIIDNHIVRKWPKLTDVDFCCHSLDKTAWKILIDAVGGQLRRLRISHILCDVFDSPFLTLGQCHQLEELVIDKPEGVVTTLLGVIDNLPNLRRLELDCSRLYDNGNNLPGFFSLAQAATRLESLKLHNCTGLTDFCLSAIASRCLELTHVTFSSCYRFTPTGFYEVISQCTKLKTVRVQRCHHSILTPATRKKVLELNANVVLLY